MRFWIGMLMAGFAGAAPAELVSTQQLTGAPPTASPDTSSVAAPAPAKTAAAAASTPAPPQPSVPPAAPANAQAQRQHDSAPAPAARSAAPARQLAAAPAALAVPALTTPPPAPALPDPTRVVQAALPGGPQPPLRDDPAFPHLPILRTNVAFWTRVFAEWSENQSVVHDMDDLSRVYTVLDFREQAAVLDPAGLAALRSREEKRAREAFTALLRRVDALQLTPDQMDSEERRVYRMYAGSTDPHRFKDAIDAIRIQRGLRERTAHALEVSGRYLPQMEKVFADNGLPTLLTRLPLMESSFNLEAYSKAGAAGVWQFIPSSARIYMRLNEVVDDRRDPWFSTVAAAHHLKDDYEKLQDWPLAVTAYNYGRGGLVRALAAVNGSTLTDLLQRYDGPRFGFASRNYYSEFLAAADVERDWRKHYGELQRLAPVQYETVETRDYVPYETLRKLSGVDSSLFRMLNPAYRDEVISGKLYVPPGHLIRVPAGAADHFRLAYASLGSDQRFAHQREFYLIHVLQRGESIGRLARRYGVSQKDILLANGVNDPRRLRMGQALRIPRHEGIVIAAAEEERAPRAIKTSVQASRSTPGLRVHRVLSGQTLSTIAKRYQTTVRELRDLNHLGDGDALRVGAILKIPSSG